jgi:hypothetical protein
MESGIFHRDTPGAPRAPGVYYETRAEPRPQFALRTAVPVFVGFAEWMSSERDSSGIHHIDRWQQFLHWYKPLPESYLGHAVRGFFENGGEQCVVMPVRSNRGDPENMRDALVHSFSPGAPLDNFDDIDLVCVPDAMLPRIRETGSGAVLAIQSAVLEHCRRMGDRFAILDGFASDPRLGPAPDNRGVGEAISHWRSLPPEHGALYFPWVHVRKSLFSGISDALSGMALPCDRQATGNRDSQTGFADFLIPRLVPPCGHVAGVYSRTDARIGVHKAPANEILEGVLEPGVDLTDAEHETLNQAGVNCLRNLGGRGIRVWGARTLSGQPQWRYVNVRRLFLTLTRWIRQNMHDLVFEGNDPLLWEHVGRRLTAHCRDLFDRGALMGDSPAQAFFVKCDAETNTRESREAGTVIADVGLAPAVPAEFVVVRITQSASTIAVSGLNLL